MRNSCVAILARTSTSLLLSVCFMNIRLTRYSITIVSRILAIAPEREGNAELTREELAEKIASSLAGREQLLKLLSMNNFDMEANSRQELLTAFKMSYGRSMELVRMLLAKFCPDMSEADMQNFIYTFYPFMFGIYPYTAVTEKQRTAMQEAGIDYVYQTVYELTYNCLIRLLS